MDPMKFTIYHLDNSLTVTSRAEGNGPHEAFLATQQDENAGRFVSQPGLYMVYPTDNTGEQAHHRMSAVIQVVETPAPIHDAVDMVERVEPPRRTHRRRRFF